MKTKSALYDLIALSSSLVCAIHCAAVPIVLSFSSLAGLHFLHNPWIEWSFISLGLIFVFVSLFPSYSKVHQNPWPLFIVAFGFGLIALGRLAGTELWETFDTVTGAVLVASAHFVNWKLLRAKKTHTH